MENTKFKPRTTQIIFSLTTLVLPIVLGLTGWVKKNLTLKQNDSNFIKYLTYDNKMGNSDFIFRGETNDIFNQIIKEQEVL